VCQQREAIQPTKPDKKILKMAVNKNNEQSLHQQKQKTQLENTQKDQDKKAQGNESTTKQNP